MTKKGKAGRRATSLFTITAILFMLSAVIAGAAGCGREKTEQGEPEKQEKMSIVTTIFPYYDFIRQIAGNKAEITLIVPAGMDSHSFEPTPADVKKIQEADVIIRNGGSMEHWMDEILVAADVDQGHVYTMMDYVELFAEELVEGMEPESEEHKGHSHSGEGQNHEEEYDEHIWTSPKNALAITEKIQDILSAEDPEGEAVYRENGNVYKEQLKNLDKKYQDLMETRKRNMIIVGDKFPFRYLAEDYGLEYRAAFSGCSEDSEPSAKTIAYLINKVKEEKIPAVYYLELSTRRVAEIISEETEAEPLLLHSCHNVTRREFDSGITYMQLMENNLENLRKGLDE